GDVAIVGEVGAEDRAGQRPDRRAGTGGDASGQYAVAGEDAWAAPGQRMLLAETLEIAPHVAAPDRLEVEGRVLDAEQLREDRAEEERLVFEFHTRVGARVLDAEGRNVAVRGSELEPELHVAQTLAERASGRLP